MWQYKNDRQQVLVGSHRRPRWVEGPGGFLEEVAFKLSLEGGLAWGEWRGEWRWGLPHRTGPRARQVWA